jgi:hypothetical protein
MVWYSIVDTILYYYPIPYPYPPELSQYLIDSEILIPLLPHVESPPLDMSNQKYNEGV